MISADLVRRKVGLAETATKQNGTKKISTIVARSTFIRPSPYGLKPFTTQAFCHRTKSNILTRLTFKYGLRPD